MSSQNSDHRHFFKVILENSLQQGQLMIPRSFVKQYGEELSNPVILMLPNGAKWEVHWTKRDRDIWFHKGWKQFSQHYSLRNGHFLVFRYEGGFQFQVLIFNETALEIIYPTIISITDDGEGKNIESHQGAKKSDDESSLLHEKMKTSSGARRGASSNDKKWSKTESNKRKKEAQEDIIEAGNALERAKSFQSDKPFFIRLLCPSYNFQNLLAIPGWFSKEYMNGFEETASIVVSEDMNKTWSVRIKFSDASNKTTITTGWLLIVHEYNLKVNDVCVFEMIHSHCTNISFKVTIFRSRQEPRSKQFQDGEVPRIRRFTRSTILR